ncbi:unnamed protein product [Adineta steineri]|uniref:RING-type domain-containing protein n=1 Tax=Adineta steineri TaxID=433720 RepID=A0A814XST5_9BILA|nr:unnamed protein product [Adineta steineri]CAF1219878.1 unnamed protein product [Adineta steineri]
MAAAIPRHLLETLVNCPACSQRYTEPRVLPTCGHTICTTCLENEWNSQESSSSPTTDTIDEKLTHYCPVQNCRKEICSTIKNYTDLPINQTVLDLVESCNFHVEATGQCQVCNQSPSFVKCSHCCLFVCFECANQHRREALTTLTNNINTLEQDYLAMNDLIDHARHKLIEVKQKSIEGIRLYYTSLIDELRSAQATNEDIVERQSSICTNELESLIDEHKQRCEQINKTIQDLRITITDWSTIEQFKHLQLNLTHIQEDIREANQVFHERLPEMKLFEIDNDECLKKSFSKNQDSSSSQIEELVINNNNGKQNSSASSRTARNHQTDDSSSAASSTINNDHVKASISTNDRAIKKHSNGQGNHYKSLNTIGLQQQQQQQQASTNSSDDTNNNSIIEQQVPQQTSTSSSSNTTSNHHAHRVHPPSSANLLPKTVSNSMADLSLVTQNQKMSLTPTRLPTFQSKLDNCNIESYKKIPLSQSFDWGMLAITNTDLILLYNKDKSSLVIFDASGHENERIQWSDGDIKDLCIYHDDSIIIVGEHKQASKPIECKLYICNLTRKQLERERVVERGLNCQRVASDTQFIFYASEKGCNKSKISVFDHELQLQITFESGVEIRSLVVDSQCCYILGKRREREPARYFLEKRQKNGQLVRRIDLYEINVDNMNRLILDSVSHGVIVTDGGNKKVWAIGPEGEKKAIQYRPWPWSVGFLTTDVLLILHAGCLTFHAVNHHKQINNGTKVRNSITNTEKV